MKIALLTCQALPNLSASDQDLIPALAQHNIFATAEIWDNPTINWQSFDYLIFRNTWDYYEKQEQFNTWLKKIEKLEIKTLNSIEIVNQNKHKFYLKDLEKKGIQILPTIFINQTQSLDLKSLLPKSWTKAVLKPAFSAGSYQTEVFENYKIEEINHKFSPIAAQKDLLLQQFIPEIISEGETSFIFFNKKFSHAVNKKPKPGDFRIQIQFGGQYTVIEPSLELIQQAQNIVDLFPENLLYARVDTIIIDNKIHLMEVECIEPDLYLNLSKRAKNNFINAILSKIKPQIKNLKSEI